MKKEGLQTQPGLILLMGVRVCLGISETFFQKSDSLKALLRARRTPKAASPCWRQPRLKSLLALKALVRLKLPFYLNLMPKRGRLLPMGRPQRQNRSRPPSVPA